MRIIAGKAKGMTLKSPKTSATRPTQDKVREALFSTIFQIVEGSTVLELFAGSGAIGIEAVSRGAASAVLVDSSKPAHAAMIANIKAAKLDEQCKAVCSTAESFLRSSRHRYDLIVADPPYHKEETPDDWVAWLLGDSKVEERLEDGGLLIVETHAHYRMAVPPQWSLHSDRSYGKTRLWYFYAVPGDK